MAEYKRECPECFGKGFTIKIPEQYKCITKTCRKCDGNGVKEESDD